MATTTIIIRWFAVVLHARPHRPQTQHKPLRLAFRRLNDAVFVLQPQIPHICSAQGEAITSLSVRVEKVAKAPEPRDVAPCLDRRDVNRFQARAGVIA